MMAGLIAGLAERRTLPTVSGVKPQHLAHGGGCGRRSRRSPARREILVRGRSIMLFTRLRADDRAFWFLGPATYRGHVGEKPMAITWELETPLPGDLYQSFAAAVA